MLNKPLEEKWRRKPAPGIFTIDSHTEGEVTRLVLGFEGVQGRTMAAKRAFLMQHADQVRRLLTREPRGRDMLAAVLTNPVTPGADFGLIYMDARRYPYLCGHGAIGAVTTLIEAGMLKTEGEQQRILVDTPSGPLETTAFIKENKVIRVALRMVPSFVYQTNQRLKVEGLGGLIVDLVCVGGFFVMVDEQQLPLALTLDNRKPLASLGMDIIAAANQQLKVSHPTRPEVKTVDVVEFYGTDDLHHEKGRNMVIYGEAHMDRSPCGTGTTAKMTLLHHKSLLDLNQIHQNFSPLGTAFEGRLVAETTVGDLPAVIAEIRGSAYITGIHEFVVDTTDPFPEGFMV